MELRLVSYNIHRAIGIDRRFRPERIVKILSHYNPDIILLQEVDSGAPRSRNLDLAKELAQDLGLPYYAVGHNVTLRKGRYGNATLSRFPILRERNIDLTIDNKKRRGCQHTLINITPDKKSSFKLDVFNLHLGLSARERHKQIQLLSHSKEFRDLGDDHRCILGGDFNDWRSLLYPYIADVMNLKCATQYKSGRQAIRTYPSFSPTAGLDRVFYRGKIKFLDSYRCRLRTSKVASDHLPIITDLRLQ